MHGAPKFLFGANYPREKMTNELVATPTNTNCQCGRDDVRPNGKPLENANEPEIDDATRPEVGKLRAAIHRTSIMTFY